MRGGRKMDFMHHGDLGSLVKGAGGGTKGPRNLT